MARRIKPAPFRFKPFSQKQKRILTWWLPESGVSDAEGIIADGATRSGKTVCMALAFVQWSMATFNGQNFGMCGKTVGSFRRNVLSVMKQMLTSRGYEYSDRRSDNLLVITRDGITNYYYIFGGKDEGSQDLMRVCGVLGQMYRITGAHEVAEDQVVIGWGNGVLFDEEKTRTRMLGEVQANLLQPERYLGFVYKRPCDTPAQRAKIRKDYMPEVADDPEEDE